MSPDHDETLRELRSMVDALKDGERRLILFVLRVMLFVVFGVACLAGVTIWLSKINLDAAATRLSVRSGRIDGLESDLAAFRERLEKHMLEEAKARNAQLDFNVEAAEGWKNLADDVNRFLDEYAPKMPRNK